MLIASQINFISSYFFEGTLTIFELPDKRPKMSEYAKLVGTFEGVMWNKVPNPNLTDLSLYFFNFRIFFPTKKR